MQLDRSLYLILINAVVIFAISRNFAAVIFFHSFAFYYLSKLLNISKKFIILLFPIALLPLFLKRLFFENQNWIFFGFAFYSLYVLSFLFESFWNEEKADFGLFSFISYVTFFPAIFAGPVKKFKDFLIDLNQKLPLSKEVLITSLILILNGLFQKIVIFDNLTYIIRSTQKNIEIASGIQILIFILIAKIYLFYGISFTSKLSQGIAYVLGVRLQNNFNLPFLSTNIKEFWKRWHMTVNEWISAYIFFPLLTTRIAKVGGVKAVIFCCFLFLGLWHGFKLTFLIYGLLQAAFLIGYILYNEKNNEHFRLPKWLKILGFYTLFLAIPGVLFLSPSLESFYKIFIHLKTNSFLISSQLEVEYFWELLNVLLVVTIYESARFINRNKNWNAWFLLRSKSEILLLIIFFLIVLFSFGSFERQESFAYWKL